MKIRGVLEVKRARNRLNVVTVLLLLSACSALGGRLSFRNVRLNFVFCVRFAFINGKVIYIYT